MDELTFSRLFDRIPQSTSRWSWSETCVHPSHLVSTNMGRLHSIHVPFLFETVQRALWCTWFNHAHCLVIGLLINGEYREVCKSDPVKEYTASHFHKIPISWFQGTVICGFWKEETSTFWALDAWVLEGFLVRKMTLDQVHERLEQGVHEDEHASFQRCSIKIATKHELEVPSNRMFISHRRTWCQGINACIFRSRTSMQIQVLVTPPHLTIHKSTGTVCPVPRRKKRAQIWVSNGRGFKEIGSFAPTGIPEDIEDATWMVARVETQPSSPWVSIDIVGLLESSHEFIDYWSVIRQIQNHARFQLATEKRHSASTNQE